jgi:hypothetical protein
MNYGGGAHGGSKVLRRAISTAGRGDRAHRGQHGLQWGGGGFGTSGAKAWVRGRAASSGRRGGTATQNAIAPMSSNSLQISKIEANRAQGVVPYLGTALRKAWLDA